ncbi:MAG: hypothetical protein DRQ78_09625, partial [Epsilonproteobacteria bacterium]
ETETEEETETETETEEEISFLEDTDDNESLLDDLVDTLASEEIKETINTPIVYDSEEDLISFDNTEDIEKLPEVSDAYNEDEEDIFIDISSLSKLSDNSEKEYIGLLDTYLDTAIFLEKDLQNNHEEIRTEAIETLSSLAQALHIPSITTTLEKLKTNDSQNQETLVTSFYNTLARLTTYEEERKEEDQVLVLDKEEELVVVEKPTVLQASEGGLDFSDVEPIHFDFQIQVSADELSLPVDLVEEFIEDFIAQMHEKAEDMLRAYDEKDMDSLHKTAHLLKGVASNLRITPLAESLRDVQYCEDEGELESLMKKYWAQFLSFERLMHNRSN